MTSLAELLAQKAELERLIHETQRAEREQAIAQVRQLMAQHGLTMADVVGQRPSAPRASRDTTTPSKVAPKYRHPDTGETWSGRGLKPRWLVAALEQGRRLDEFAL
jgi:DNA-binding protein H-NS